jgi:hypothetical protein
MVNTLYQHSLLTTHSANCYPCKLPPTKIKETSCLIIFGHLSFEFLLVVCKTVNSELVYRRESILAMSPSIKNNNVKFIGVLLPCEKLKDF